MLRRISSKLPGLSHTAEGLAPSGWGLDCLSYARRCSSLQASTATPAVTGPPATSTQDSFDAVLPSLQIHAHSACGTGRVYPLFDRQASSHWFHSTRLSWVRSAGALGPAPGLAAPADLQRGLLRDANLRPASLGALLQLAPLWQRVPDGTAAAGGSNRSMDEAGRVETEVWADSVRRKRQRKMNKHKHRKRRKAQRHMKK